MIVLVMGVSGAGKTTIGRLLAGRLGSRFIDADDHHPAANIAKMAAGIPLDDQDRWPWLDALNVLAKREENAVLACSALKEAYRQRLLAGITDARIVYLHGTKAVIASRLAERKHRYMPASLLDSQLATLEPPQHAISIDVAADPAECVAQILSFL
jgi:carbohydrate kinase (thermoresistant glucokinase family)